MTPPPLQDRFGRRHTYLRISVTERCNLRCVYCMPEEGVAVRPHAEMLTFEEIERLVRLMAGAGVTKIRLTGGEPLVRKELPVLVGSLARVPGIQKLSITTNGLLLSRHLHELMAAGVTGYNLSLDTMRPERFRSITRRDGLDTVLHALHLLLAHGVRPRVNCVVMRGVNDDELPDFAALARDYPLDVRFIEFMPFGGNAWRRDVFMPASEMAQRLQCLGWVPAPEAHQPEDTSRMYAAEGWAGRIGYIASMSQPFCHGCNRLRLTADGGLKVCLFGHTEINLRDPMRAGALDGELLDLIRSALARKQESHGGMEVLPARPNRPMITIGG